MTLQLNPQMLHTMSATWMHTGHTHTHTHARTHRHTQGLQVRVKHQSVLLRKKKSQVFSHSECLLNLNHSAESIWKDSYQVSFKGITSEMIIIIITLHAHLSLMYCSTGYCYFIVPAYRTAQQQSAFTNRTDDFLEIEIGLMKTNSRSSATRSSYCF